MSFFHPRSLGVSIAAALLVAACSEEIPTSVETQSLDVPEDLSVFVPSLSRTDVLAPSATDEWPDPSPKPESPPAATGGIEGTGLFDEFAEIWNAHTTVGFRTGNVWADGYHDYTGNKGRIETTAYLSFEGTALGQQTAVTEQYTPNLLDFGLSHSIGARAFVYTEHDCGLSVRGASTHSAWHNWFLGGTAPEWGLAVYTSQAAPRYGEACPPPEPEPDPWSDGGNGGSSSGDDYGYSASCWYWITYDLNTGEILDAQLLYCEGGNEGG